MKSERPAQTVSLPVVRTKLMRPPLNGSEVPRGDMLARLRLALNTRLIEVTTPAGYGKTTAVAALLQSLPDVHGVWLSLDSGDAVPLRFVTLLAAGLAPFCRSIATVQSQLTSGAVVDAAMLLLDGLTGIEGDLLLVLDNVQHLEQPSLLELLDALIEHSPRQLHWILLGRRHLPITMARRVIAGQAIRFTAADLQLSREEIAAYLSAVGVDVAEAEALTRIQQRSGGWFAGLQSAVLARQRYPAAALTDVLRGDERGLSEYFTDEVFAGLPPALADFLVNCAVLERLNPELCDVLRDADDSAALISEARRRQLFLQPDDAFGRWFVMHGLWREYLAAQPHRRMSRAQRVAAIERAAVWLAAHDDLSAALRLLIQSELAASATELMLQHVRAALLAHRLDEVTDWLQQLPPSVIDDSPQLLIVRAWLDFLAGRYPEVISALRRCVLFEPWPAELSDERLLLAQVEPLAAGDKRRIFINLAPALARFSSLAPYVGGWIALLAAGCFQPDLAAEQTAVDLMMLARRAFGRAGSPVGELYARAALLPPLRESGDLTAEAAECRDGIVFARTYVQLAAAREALSAFAVMGGEALFWLNRLSEAVELLRSGLLDAIEHGNRVSALQAAAWLEICRALGYEPAGPLPETPVSGWSVEESDRLPLGERGMLLYTAAVRALLPGGSAVTCRKMQQLLQVPLELSGLDQPDSVLTGALLFHLTQRSAVVELRQWLPQAMTEAARRGRLRLQIHLTVAAAVLARRDGEPARARKYLRQALALLERCPFQRLPLLFPELERVMHSLDHPLAAQLSAVTDGAALRPAGQLSDQELRILRLLAAGHRQADIALELAISVPTVKWYLSRLYDRLNLKNRREAIVWVRKNL